jgi:hypothetical protein
MVKHDTGMFNTVAAAGPDEGVRTCQVHKDTCDGLYGAINARVSLRYAALLCGMAVAFGVGLFAWTTWRCDRTDNEVSDMTRKTIKIESDLEHIKASLAETKLEQRQFRTDMMAEFKRLQDMMRNGPR